MGMRMGKRGTEHDNVARINNRATKHTRGLGMAHGHGSPNLREGVFPPATLSFHPSSELLLEMSFCFSLNGLLRHHSDGAAATKLATTKGNETSEACKDNRL